MEHLICLHSQEISESEAGRVQSTPEKKRLSWKPILEEIVWHDSADGGEEARRGLVRYNMSKECNGLLDPAGHADEACLASLQNHSADVARVSENFEASTALKGPESVAREDVPANPESASSPTLPPASTDAPVKEANEATSSGLSEEEKHAGMKRRYSMLQQNLRMPAEEERRLKRERLRSLVPIWSKTRADAQSLDGGRH
jgi:hypothetical protein